MSKILVGTASWSDKSLVDSGKFYPPTAKSSEDRLKFYASEFPIVEVDSSYYGIPDPRNGQLWAERTPDAFKFNVKAFRLFTGHQTPPAVLPKDIREVLEPTITTKNVYYKDIPEEIRDELWDRFRDALAPLKHAGKLGAVHFQFAPWMAFHPENFRHIEECMAKLDGYQLAIEFRNKTWFTEKHTPRTLAFERERNLVNVIADAPQGPTNTIPAVWEVTCPELAIVRLHGRNHETWNKKGLKTSAERFNYDYATEELSDIAASVRKLAEKVGEVDVILNNNYEDQGQRNGREIARMLKS